MKFTILKNMISYEEIIILHWNVKGTTELEIQDAFGTPETRYSAYLLEIVLKKKRKERNSIIRQIN